MQKFEGKASTKSTLLTKTKEITAAALLLCIGGTALAWGAGQISKPAPTVQSPDDQCRMLINGLLAGDSELVFKHLHPNDARHLQLDIHKLKAFQEELLSPRLSTPYAWRPRVNRVHTCQSREGIVFVHMQAPADDRRTSLSLRLTNEDGTVTFRYDDLLKVLSNLDRASNLNLAQSEARMKRDAEAMLRSKLEGFSTLHPSRRAAALYKAAEQKAAEMRREIQEAPIVAAPVSTASRKFLRVTPPLKTLDRPAVMP